MLAKLAKQKIMTVKPPSDKLIDLIMLARAKQVGNLGGMP